MTDPESLSTCKYEKYSDGNEFMLQISNTKKICKDLVRNIYKFDNFIVLGLLA